MVLVHLLGNPAAGGGRGDLDAVRARLLRGGHEVHALTAPDASAAAEVAKSAVAGGADRVVTVGGDGLVRIALQAVAGTGTVLGIVPQGTGNDFARALGLPLTSLDAAVDAAVGEAVPVDAMWTNHGWVASVATLGFSGDVTARANALRFPRGQHRYTVATFLQLSRLRSVRATVEIDGVLHHSPTTMLSVGNTAYFGGGMRICPDAAPDDGLLQTVVVGDVPRRTFLRVFPRVFSGTHVRHAAVTTYRSAAVRIDGEGCDVWADGDLLGPLPVDCRVVPGAVLVAGAVLTARGVGGP